MQFLRKIFKMLIIIVKQKVKKKMSVITDSYTMQITIIQHGIAHIVLPVIYPASVEMNTPFDITYTVKNEGNVADTLYGHLLVGGSELPDSAWTADVPVNGTVTETYTHPGISSATQILLEVGHI